jgi:hypothetical protein
MIETARPMRIAAVKTLGVLLIVFAAGELALHLFAAHSVEEAVAVLAVATLTYFAGSWLLQRPAAAARRLMAAGVIAIGASLAAGVKGLDTGAPLMTPRQREAFEYLRLANRFEMPRIGFLVVRSRGYLAMRILRRSVGADDAFKELVRSGRPAGQLYGLCGLYDTDPPAFSAALPRYRNAAGEVGFFWGCILDRMRVPRHADLEQWASNEGRGQYGRDVDICGGALPAIFRERDPDEADALNDERLADFHTQP